MTAIFGSFFKHVETGEIRQSVIIVLRPNIQQFFLIFCYSHFFIIPKPMMYKGLLTKHLQNYVTIVCFTCQFSHIEKLTYRSFWGPKQPQNTWAISARCRHDVPYMGRLTAVNNVSNQLPKWMVWSTILYNSAAYQFTSWWCLMMHNIYTTSGEPSRPITSNFEIR